MDDQTTSNPPLTVLLLIEKARAAQQVHEQTHDTQLEIPDWKGDAKTV